MKRRWLTNTIRIIFLLIIAFAIFWLIYGKQWYENSNNKVKPVAEHAPFALSTWVVDWDWESSSDDMQAVAQNWDSVQLFLGYFDTNNELLWGEEKENFIADARQKLLNDETEIPIYLTLVNDRIHDDGSSTQKDESIVTTIIESAESQYKFIEHVMTIIHQNGLDGLEMDFENISAQYWPDLLHFYELLHHRLAAEGIPLRIVLEPKVKFEDLELPEGPQYVVMAYNLFGYHSGAGPKADRTFIQKLTARMEYIPGDPTVAIATGGFAWSENGTIVALSEQTALDLQTKAIDEHIERDAESGSIQFEYLDEHGVMHTVWTADHETIKTWIEMIHQRGYSNIAIWRMGDLSEQTLLYLDGLK